MSKRFNSSLFAVPTCPVWLTSGFIQALPSAEMVVSTVQQHFVLPIVTSRLLRREKAPYALGHNLLVNAYRWSAFRSGWGDACNFAETPWHWDAPLGSRRAGHFHPSSSSGQARPSLPLGSDAIVLGGHTHCHLLHHPHWHAYHEGDTDRCS